MRRIARTLAPGDQAASGAAGSEIGALRDSSASVSDRMAAMLARQPPQQEPAPHDSAISRVLAAPLRARRRISRSLTARQLHTIKARAA